MSLLRPNLFNLCRSFSAFRSTTQRCLYSSIPKTFPETVPDSVSENVPEIKSSEDEYDELENLRIEARKVRKAFNIRTRCIWTKQEDEKLMSLYEKHGEAWGEISSQFADRTYVTCLKRVRILQDIRKWGPWSDSDKKLLIELCGNRDFEEIDNWEEIQSKLSYQRPLFLIKQKFKGINPKYTKGKWSEQEANLLETYYYKYGDNWEKISSLIETRSSIQCRERWVFQQRSSKKGRFTPEEDQMILKAVEKYGRNFGVICKVIGTERLPRHVSQHFQGKLDPEIDKSKWTEEEVILVYKTFLNEGSMKKAKEVLGSKRSVRNMWNYIHAYEKRNNIKRNTTGV